MGSAETAPNRHLPVERHIDCRRRAPEPLIRQPWLSRSQSFERVVGLSSMMVCLQVEAGDETPPLSESLQKPHVKRKHVAISFPRPMKPYVRKVSSLPSRIIYWSWMSLSLPSACDLIALPEAYVGLVCNASPTVGPLPQSSGHAARPAGSCHGVIAFAIERPLVKLLPLYFILIIDHAFRGRNGSVLHMTLAALRCRPRWKGVC